MPKHPEKSKTRAEKLSLLSAMLGPDAMARVRGTQPETETAPGQVDPDRVAWHRNRLLERLRTQSETPADRKPQSTPRASNLDHRIKSLLDPETIVQEHPAVIARLMKTLERGERTDLLRKLPGPMARNIIRRMRES